MSKKIKNNNSLFEGFKPPKVNSVPKKEEKPKKEPCPEPETVEKVEETAPAPVAKEEIIEDILEKSNTITELAKEYGTIRTVGRPKQFEGKYHNYSARIREDLFEYAKTQVGEGTDYQSINDYLNRLITIDMLSKK